jgi:alpha-2-macroglobulin
VRVLEGAEREATLANESTDDWKLDDPTVVVLEARQRFAPEQQIVLHWGAGISAPSGVALDEEQTFEYEVRPPFGARFSCDRIEADADCVPLTAIRLVFSSPVAWEAAAKIALRGEGEQRWPAQRRWDWDGDALVDAIEFAPPFPPRATLRAEVPADLADDAGRTLDPGKALEVKTDGYPPLAKFSARFGILETASPVLPVTVRHLEADAALRTQGVTSALAARHTKVTGADPKALLAWLHAVGRSADDRSVFAMDGLDARPADVALPKAQAGDDAEVVGIPLAGAGLHVVEIESRVLGDVILDPPGPLFVASAALVTNLAVHFKWGNEASLVWVTSLDRGEPVPGARVRVVSCTGAVLADATTDAQGLAPVAGLPTGDAAPSCNENGYSDYSMGLLVLAEREGDLGLAHTSWSDGIEPWRFEVPIEYRPRAFRAATVLDRMLFRAGETVHMKHVLRKPVQAGFARVAPDVRPERAKIVHLGTLDSWDVPLEFGADGAAETEWTIPTQAKLGSYEIQIVPKGGQDWDAQTTGTFRVEAFRVPLARGVIQPPSSAVVGAAEFPVDVAVQFLAGGFASSLPVTIRSQTRERAVVGFPDYPGFSFATGDVEEGVRTRRFGEHEAAPPAPAVTQELTLDGNGTGRAHVAVSDLETEGPREVQVELEFRDPNGEVQTSSRTVPIWSASRAVGLRLASVRSPRDAIRLEAAVVDTDGKPIWLAGVEIEAYRTMSYSSRKRVVGGFYAYEDVEEVVKLGTFCTGRTDRAGRFSCEAPPPGRGDLVFVARSADWRGRASASQTSVYLSGDDGWFAQGDGDRMDLVPEKPRYEPGESARFQVRMPFRAATALVTVEREGVAERFVTKVTADDPYVSVPMLASHAPNVFVSVLAVRGRVDAAPPTATVDLGKPAYRIGVAEVQVGWRASQLAVRVTPERTAYKVRETARVAIAVRDSSGAAPPPGSEIALAAVDEGLLELMPNSSWKLIDAMMDRRSYDVRTSTAQLQVVGKRHFGRKALPAGGGGGSRPTRELFDTLLLWRGRVALDAQGATPSSTSR